MSLRLTDGVIVLDRHTDDDVAAHLAGEDEEQARRFGWHPARSTPETVRRAFRDWNESWVSDGETRTFAMREVASSSLVGGCQLRLRGDEAEISYWVFPPFRCRGYATRAVKLATAWASGELSLRRIEARIEPDNESSRNVARRAGFTEDGIVQEAVRGTVRDMVVYSLEHSYR